VSVKSTLSVATLFLDSHDAALNWTRERWDSAPLQSPVLTRMPGAGRGWAAFEPSVRFIRRRSDERTWADTQPCLCNSSAIHWP
jgi:hypothetical protein